MEIFLTIAVMYGITFSIKDAKLFDRPRTWLASNEFFSQLISCAYCVGFHSGWFTYLLLHGAPTSLDSFLSGLLAYSFAGVTVSGSLDAILQRIENS